MYNDPAVKQGFPMTGKSESVPRHLEVAEVMSKEISSFPHGEVFEMVFHIRKNAQHELQKRGKELGEMIELRKNEWDQLQKLIDSI